MGDRVRVLPDHVANRIAAGEVVERPASVLKELVENAVDAAATRVRVRVDGAGKRLVAVEDDGVGMGRDDALLALERHATSKIATEADLEGIGTLGFRGEALPSIASVSRFRLVTRPDGAPSATELRVEGGTLVAASEVPGPRGTLVEVADLFHNMPARLKFLKTDATELRALVETATQLALAHHDVGFELVSGGRRLLGVPPGQSLEERAGELAGRGVDGGLHWARRDEDDGRSLTLGYAAPHAGRGHRRGVRLFVNGRPVQDRLLLRAVLDGYRGVLEPGRYPVAFLWLEVPPAGVDVNVHPAKREVRFRDERGVFRWVAGRVAEAVARAPWTAGRSAGSVPGPAQPRPEVGRVAEALGAYSRSLPPARERARPLPAGAGRRPVFGGAGGSGGRGYDTGAGGAPPVRPPRQPLAETTGRFGRLRYLGAFDGTYLLFEDESSRELVVLDQHAAHERICYEQILARAGEPGRAQPLLFPVTLDCSPAEMSAFSERVAVLERLGFGVSAVGETALAITEVPAALSGGGAEAAVRDLLSAEEEDLAAGGDPERALEHAARRAACSAAVKARRALDRSEAEALVSRLEALDNPGHCPHGRPLMVRLGRSDLEGMFHRR